MVCIKCGIESQGTAESCEACGASLSANELDAGTSGKPANSDGQQAGQYEPPDTPYENPEQQPVMTLKSKQFNTVVKLSFALSIMLMSNAIIWLVLMYHEFVNIGNLGNISFRDMFLFSNFIEIIFGVTAVGIGLWMAVAMLSIKPIEQYQIPKTTDFSKLMKYIERCMWFAGLFVAVILPDFIIELARSERNKRGAHAFYGPFEIIILVLLLAVIILAAFTIIKSKTGKQK